MNLSPHFTLAEMTASATATSIGDPNQPGPTETDNLRVLCDRVLEPVRAHFGLPVRVNSGYRSPRTNKKVGSSSTSQHRVGEAADFEIQGISNADVAIWMRDNLAFDQLILENYTHGIAGSGWVHVSYRAGRLRQKSMTMTMASHGAVYANGINP